MSTIFLAFLVVSSIWIQNGPATGAGQEKIVLKAGAEVEAGGGVLVRFVEVLEDSRCPKGVDCVWAGNAKIRLTVRAGDECATLQLNSALAPREAEWNGKSFSLVNLAPYPASGVEIEPSEYIATISVIRK